MSAFADVIYTDFILLLAGTVVALLLGLGLLSNMGSVVGILLLFGIFCLSYAAMGFRPAKPWDVEFHDDDVSVVTSTGKDHSKWYRYISTVIAKISLPSVPQGTQVTSATKMAVLGLLFIIEAIGVQYVLIL
ncbi:MAG: hypothetical protein ABEI06_01405 [Halobacteriaceae archaeon]